MIIAASVVATASTVAEAMASASTAIGVVVSAFVPTVAPIGHTSGNPVSLAFGKPFSHQPVSPARRSARTDVGLRIFRTEARLAGALWRTHDETSLTDPGVG